MNLEIKEWLFAFYDRKHSSFFLIIPFPLSPSLSVFQHFFGVSDYFYDPFLCSCNPFHFYISAFSVSFNCLSLFPVFPFLISHFQTICSCFPFLNIFFLLAQILTQPPLIEQCIDLCWELWSSGSVFSACRGIIPVAHLNAGCGAHLLSFRFGRSGMITGNLCF